ncbi:MAG TPA: efflux RND transporter periplasmic adaptor subunit [Candidatus Paceibacterota bacterium]|nr:efflux RND transporter periplasmic adaptor subunit [Candidatus Paceibacterota bacterium]
MPDLDALDDVREKAEFKSLRTAEKQQQKFKRATELIPGRILEVMIEEGQEVAEGQVLARLDGVNIQKECELADARLEAARLALKEIEIRLAEARAEQDRVRALVREGIATESDRDRAEAEAASLAARLDQQRAEVAVVERELAARRQDLEDTVIRAPFAGVVVSKNAQPGEMISPVSAGGGFTRTGIGTIVDMKSLEIEVDVNESYLQRVRPGQRVQAVLDAYPDWRIAARVIAIVPTADRQKATVKVRIGVDELDPRILPDMGVKVAFQDPEGAAVSRPAVVVPAAAVRQVEGRDVVWVAAGGRLERRAVRRGASQGSDVSLLSGVAAGEKVVVEGPSDLREGGRIREMQP